MGTYSGLVAQVRSGTPKETLHCVHVCCFINFLTKKAKVIFNFGNYFKIMKLIFSQLGLLKKACLLELEEVFEKVMWQQHKVPY
jgi:hypothetical protein